MKILSFFVFGEKNISVKHNLQFCLYELQFCLYELRLYKAFLDNDTSHV